MSRRLLAGLVLALGAGPAAASDWKLPDWAWRAEFQVDAEQEWPESPLARLRFDVGAGEVQDGGADLRVTDAEGQPVPHQVIHASAGRWVELLARVEGRGDRFHVYHGNPKAAAPAPAGFEVRRGLVLETRERGWRDCPDFPAFRRLLTESQVSFGASAVERVFHGMNPFGPSARYLSIYRGWFRAQAAGDHVFATASEDGSFVFVDGKLVCQWPGSHSMAGGARGEHRGSVRLEAGVHFLEYYHEKFKGGQQGCALFWLPPGAKKLAPMDRTDFPGFLRATQTGAAARSGALRAAFAFEPVHEVTLPGGHPMTLVRFADRSRSASPIESWRWEPGDNVAVEGRTSEHLYLVTGVYQATLTVTSRGETARVTRQVDTRVLFHQGPQSPPRPRLVEIVRAYPVDRLLPDQLATLAAFHRFLEEADLEAACLEALISRDHPESASHKDPWTLRLAELANRTARPALLDRARPRLLDTIERAAHPSWVLAARVALATNHYLSGRTKEALADLSALESRAAALDGATNRAVQIALGRVRLREKDLQQARLHFMKAHLHDRDPSLLPRKGAVVGAHLHRIEAAHAEERPEQALAEIEAWLESYPEDALDPQLHYQRARALHLAGRAVEAESLLSEILGRPISSALRPDALYLLALARLKLGRSAEARAAMETIEREHPESPLAEKARRWLAGRQPQR